MKIGSIVAYEGISNWTSDAKVGISHKLKCQRIVLVALLRMADNDNLVFYASGSLGDVCPIKHVNMPAFSAGSHTCYHRRICPTVMLLGGTWDGST